MGPRSTLYPGHGSHHKNEPINDEYEGQGAGQLSAAPSCLHREETTKGEKLAHINSQTERKIRLIDVHCSYNQL